MTTNELHKARKLIVDTILKERLVTTRRELGPLPSTKIHTQKATVHIAFILNLKRFEGFEDSVLNGDLTRMSDYLHHLKRIALRNGWKLHFHHDWKVYIIPFPDAVVYNYVMKGRCNGYMETN